MFWDDFIGEPSSSSNNNTTHNTRNKGKHQSLTDEELFLYNYVDDDNVPLEFYTETSSKPTSEENKIIDLESDGYSSNQDNYIYITDNEDSKLEDDIVLLSNSVDDNNILTNNYNANSNNSNTNNNSVDNNNDNRNNDGDHHEDNNNTLSDDELLALRLQLEEEEEYNNRMNRMANFNQFRFNDGFSDFYDIDDLQIHSLYSSLNDYSSPMFMNSRGYVMDLRNYVEDDELDCSYEGLLRLEERIGNVKHNLDTNLIDKNKVLKYDKNIKEIQETKCSICLLNYEKDEELRKLLCDHTFHKDCIDNWFKNSSTCPM